MDKLVKISESDNNTIYQLGNNVVSICKKFKGQIEVYLSIEAKDSNTVEKLTNNNIPNSIHFSYSPSIDITNDNYQVLLNDIKSMINNVYNTLLKSDVLNRDSFVRCVQIINDNSNNDFYNWLCSNNPNKFKIVNTFERNNQPQNISPITYPNGSDNSSGGGFTNSNNEQSINNPKVLVKTLPTTHNTGFINYYAIIFVLLMCFIVGMVISLSLLK